MMVAALTILGASAGGFAYAARGDGSCDGRQAMSGKAPGENMGQRMGQRLEQLRGELKLRPEQETAWKSWTGQMQEKMAKMQASRPDFDAMSKLSAPERMAQMLERQKARQQDMESGLASLRDFYGKLDPEQQKVFDRFQPFGGHRHGGRRGERGERGAGPQPGQQSGAERG